MSNSSNGIEKVTYHYQNSEGIVYSFADNMCDTLIQAKDFKIKINYKFLKLLVFNLENIKINLFNFII